jgi:hypothetical protein
MPIRKAKAKFVMELEVTMGTPDSLEVVSFTAIAISFACEAIMKLT